MCGLVGIFNYRRDQPVNAEELLAIREHMRTRGPIMPECGWIATADQRL